MLLSGSELDLSLLFTPGLGHLFFMDEWESDTWQNPSQREEVRSWSCLVLCATLPCRQFRWGGGGGGEAEEAGLWNSTRPTLNDPFRSKLLLPQFTYSIFLFKKKKGKDILTTHKWKISSRNCFLRVSFFPVLVRLYKSRKNYINWTLNMQLSLLNDYNQDYKSVLLS